MNMDAAAVDLMLDQEANQIVRLKDVLDQVEEQYDYCLIDCPPGVGINVLNALAAADDVIIPIKEVGVKQKHIKHILGKIGTVKEVRNIPDMEILAYFVHFPYVNLKAAPGNKKPYYVLLEDMIEPISLTVVERKGKQ